MRHRERRFFRKSEKGNILTVKFAIKGIVNAKKLKQNLQSLRMNIVFLAFLLRNRDYHKFLKLKIFAMTSEMIN